MTKPIRPKQIRAQRLLRLKLLTLLFLLAAFIYGIYWWSDRRGWVLTNDAYVTGNVITIKAPAAGIVKAIHAENTQPVQAGDLLIELDGNHARINFEQAQADLGETVRKVALLFSQSQVLQRRIATQGLTLARVRHDLLRYQKAARDDAVSAQQTQNAMDQVHELEAQIRQTEAELHGAEAQVMNSTIAQHPTVQKAAAQLRRAYLDYQRQHVLAPVSGIVAKRKAQVGEPVIPGTPLLAIVPLDHLWVEANLKETEIAQVLAGQKARVTVDAFRGRAAEYDGTVVGVHPGTGSLFALLPPENASGNYIHVIERLPVRIELNPEDLKTRPLRPGLSTITRIDVSHSANRLPEAARLTETASYHTSIYDRELQQADAIIEKVIAANMAVQP